LQIKTKSVSLKARFCRPDKAKPPSGKRCRGICWMARYTLIRPTRFQWLRLRNRHPAIRL
jgi:hypothetical protein